MFKNQNVSQFSPYRFFFYLSFLIVIICTCRVACIRLCEFLRFLCFKASSNFPQKSFWCTFFSLFSPKILVVFKNCCCYLHRLLQWKKIVRLLNFSLLMNVVLLMDSKTLRLPSFHLQQLTYINISFIFKIFQYSSHTMSSLSNITSVNILNGKFDVIRK